MYEPGAWRAPAHLARVLIVITTLALGASVELKARQDYAAALASYRADSTGRAHDAATEIQQSSGRSPFVVLVASAALASDCAKTVSPGAQGRGLRCRPNMSRRSGDTSN